MFGNKKKTVSLPFWVKVRNFLPSSAHETTSYYSTFDEVVEASFRKLLGFVPKEYDDSDRSLRERMDDHVISWLKNHPKYIDRIKIALSEDLVEVPTDVIVARKYLSKMSVELGLLGFTEVQESIDVLTEFVQRMEVKE